MKHKYKPKYKIGDQLIISKSLEQLQPSVVVVKLISNGPGYLYLLSNGSSYSSTWNTKYIESITIQEILTPTEKILYGQGNVSIDKPQFSILKFFKLG